MECKHIETPLFSVDVPIDWRVISQTPVNALLSDPSGALQVTLALVSASGEALAGYGQTATRDAHKPALEQREAQRVLERYITQRGPGRAAGKPLIQWRQQASHMACTSEFVVRPQRMSLLQRFTHRGAAVSWRYWGIVHHDTLLIIGCHGRQPIMERFRATLDQAIASVNITERRVLLGKPFTDAVLQLIRGEFPAAPVAVIDNNTIRVGGQPVNLATLHRRYLEQPDHLPEDVRSFVGRLLRRPRDPANAYPACRAHILPELYTSCPNALGGRQVVRQEWVNGLFIGYVLHSQTPVTTEHLARWGINEDALHDQAIENLVGCTQELTMEGNRSDGYTMLAFTRADRHNAVRILLPDFHRRLREHLGSTFYVAIPNHECLLAFSVENPEALTWIQAQIAGSYRKLILPLTEKLFLATADGIAGDASEGWGDDFGDA